jgi:hypothetical protein
MAIEHFDSHTEQCLLATSPDLPILAVTSALGLGEQFDARGLFPMCRSRPRADVDSSTLSAATRQRQRHGLAGVALPSDESAVQPPRDTHWPLASRCPTESNLHIVHLSRSAGRLRPQDRLPARRSSAWRSAASGSGIHALMGIRPGVRTPPRAARNLSWKRYLSRLRSGSTFDSTSQPIT